MDPRSTVVPFRQRGTEPPPFNATTFALAPRIATPQADVRVGEIARRLGIADEAWRTIITKIRLLNSRYGFPDPRTPRFVKGEMRTGPDAIVRRSLFPRARVEEWFDNHRAPAQRAADDAGEAKAAAADLSANSRRLVATLNHRAAS